MSSSGMPVEINSSTSAVVHTSGVEAVDPVRFDRKTIRDPSRAQKALASVKGSDVRRSLEPRVRSSSQMSGVLVCTSTRLTARRRPSGEIVKLT